MTLYITTKIQLTRVFFWSSIFHFCFQDRNDNCLAGERGSLFPQKAPLTALPNAWVDCKLEYQGPKWVIKRVYGSPESELAIICFGLGCSSGGWWGPWLILWECIDQQRQSYCLLPLWSTIPFYSNHLHSLRIELMGSPLHFVYLLIVHLCWHRCLCLCVNTFSVYFCLSVLVCLFMQNTIQQVFVTYRTYCLKMGKTLN